MVRLFPRRSAQASARTTCLKPGVFKVSRLGLARSRRALRCPRREGRQTSLSQIVWKQWSEKCLGHTERRLFALLGVIFWEQRAQSPLSRDKGAGGHHFPPHPQHKHKDTCHNQYSANTGCLTCLYQVPQPCISLVLPCLIKFASVPARWAPSPEDQQKPLPTSPAREFCRAYFYWK